MRAVLMLVAIAACADPSLREQIQDAYLEANVEAVCTDGVWPDPFRPGQFVQSCASACVDMPTRLDEFGPWQCDKPFVKVNGIPGTCTIQLGNDFRVYWEPCRCEGPECP